MNVFERRFHALVRGFITIAEGIVIVLTLGFYFPNWGFHYICWESERDLKKKIERRDKRVY